MAKTNSGNSRHVGTFGSYKPIMALSKESFKEMQQFFLLKIIADNPQGITAYQISTDYQLNRSTAIRMLDIFEKKDYISSTEQIIDGRANKIFALTQVGFRYLLKLKYIWLDRFVMMEELTTRSLTSTEKVYYLQEIEDLGTNEERLKYLKAMKSRHEKNLGIAKKKYFTFLKSDEIMAHVIEEIEKQDSFNRNELESFFDSFMELDAEIEAETKL